MNSPSLQKPAEKNTRQRRGASYSPLSYERIAIITAVAAGPIDKASVTLQVRADTIAAVEISKSTAYFLIRELCHKGYLRDTGVLHLTKEGLRILDIELKRIEYQRRILIERLSPRLP